MNKTSQSAKLETNLAVLEQEPTRDGYGKALAELGKENKNVVVLTGDLTESTRSNWFKEKFPDRFFEAGVAEQNMLGIAAGLALSGKIPFVSSYAVFSPGRNWDQLRVSVCYNKANVKIAGCHAGLSVGPDGATHQALEDIAITRTLPNLTVIVPADSIEAQKATIAAAKISGPVYIRFGRAKTPIITTQETPFKTGKAEIYREGKDITIIACGIMVHEALLAAEKLSEQGIEATVLNCHTIKPIDKETIINAARKTKAIITAEEHQIHGGLGSAVAEILSQNEPVEMRMMAVQDKFGESGEPQELLKAYGLTYKDIISAAKSLVQKAHAKTELCEVEQMAFDRKKLITDVHPNLTFKLKDGGIIRNIPQLKRMLAKMKDEVFTHHVNQHKNDFTSWIKDVYGDATLADAVKKHTDKTLIEKEIEKALREAFLQQKPRNNFNK